MSIGVIVDSLALPQDVRVNTRIPKKLLAEQGAKTASDRRQIQDFIEEVYWVAALKPTNIGVPDFRGAEREYLEIAVLSVVLREGAKAARLIELIHRAIPYPVLLISDANERVSVSAAHKRWSHAEAGRMVADPVVATTAFQPASSDASEQQFLASLPLSLQPRRDMLALYSGWLEQIEALAAARICGQFFQTQTEDAAAMRRAALEEYACCQRDIISLRAQAERETQMNRRVEINLAIRNLEYEVAAAVRVLSGSEIPDERRTAVSQASREVTVEQEKKSQ